MFPRQRLKRQEGFGSVEEGIKMESVENNRTRYIIVALMTMVFVLLPSVSLAVQEDSDNVHSISKIINSVSGFFSGLFGGVLSITGMTIYNIIEDNYLTNGYVRIGLYGNTSNNTILNNNMTMNYYGNTAYTYRVSAYDAAGSNSGQSSSASATTQAASSELLWETTYDCDDWNTYGDPLNCDGLGKGLSSTCGGNYEQITFAANMAAGGGGKGQRHWIGDGENWNSGGIKYTFDSRQSEFWMRWYMRWPTGFKWNPLLGQKLLYFDVGEADHYYIPHFYGFNTIRTYTHGTSQASASFGWDSVMSDGGDDGAGHKTSDGEWHCFEVHVKGNSAVGVSDGINEVWIDGVKRLSSATVDYGTTDYGWVLIGCNQKYPDNGQCLPVDFDDIAISNTGYIGPIGSPDTTPPSTPTNLQATAISSSRIDLSWTVSTDDVAVAGYRIYRNSVQIGTTAGTTYSSTGLSASTTYVYTVRAYDGAGNIGGLSNTATETTTATAGLIISDVSSSSVDDGDIVVVSGGGFGTHSLDVEWLGGKTGHIESSLEGADFSKTGWSEVPFPQFDSKYDDARSHSNSQSLLFDPRTEEEPTANEGRVGIKYDTGGEIAEGYATWWVYFDDDGNPDSNTQWKMLRINHNGLVSDDAPTVNFFNWRLNTVNGIYSPSTAMLLVRPTTSQFPPVDTWCRLEVWIKPSSAASTADGVLEYTFHNTAGIETVYSSNTVTNYDDSNRFRYWVFQNYMGNGLMDSPYAPKVWMDDIYIAKTKARVEIGDNSDWDLCTHREIQPPTAWIDNSITITVNQGSFQDGNTAYLFVVDADGAVSEGYPITFGAASESPPTRTNPAPTGTLPAGTTTTIISLTTDVQATCRYSNSLGTNYTNITGTFTNTNSTNHSTEVSGLENGNTYAYYIRCNSTEGYYNDNDWNIAFSVALPPGPDPACRLTSDAKKINIAGIYNISGIFVCEKIYLRDYWIDCINNETDIFWWNGTEWRRTATIGCHCISNTDCENNLCFDGACNYPVETFYPTVEFKDKVINASKNTLIKNIIEINNTFNKDDIFNVVIGHNNSNEVKKIWQFSFIEGMEDAKNDKEGEYTIKANSVKKIMLISEGIREGLYGNLTVKVTSYSTGFSAEDTARYTITAFEKKYFIGEEADLALVPDISMFAFVLIGLFSSVLLAKRH